MYIATSNPLHASADDVASDAESDVSSMSRESWEYHDMMEWQALQQNEDAQPLVGAEMGMQFGWHNLGPDVVVPFDQIEELQNLAPDWALDWDPQGQGSDEDQEGESDEEMNMVQAVFDEDIEQDFLALDSLSPSSQDHDEYDDMPELLEGSDSDTSDTETDTWRDASQTDTDEHTVNTTSDSTYYDSSEVSIADEEPLQQSTEEATTESIDRVNRQSQSSMDNTTTR